MSENEGLKVETQLPGATSHLFPVIADTGVDAGEERGLGKTALGNLGLLSGWEARSFVKPGAWHSTHSWDYEARDESSVRGLGVIQDQKELRI